MEYVAFDLETTGIAYEESRIIEIGAARYVDDKIVDRFDTFCSVAEPLNPFIVKLTHITDEMLKDAPSEEEAIKKFIDFVGDCRILMGHNIAAFDYSFLRYAVERNGLEKTTHAFDNFLGIDTLKISKAIISNEHSHKLPDLCEQLGIDPGMSHRAIDDAIASANVYKKLKEMYKEEAGTDELPEFFFAKGLNYRKPKPNKNQPLTPKQAAYLEALSIMYGETLEKPIEEFTKSEASREIDRIRTKYGAVQWKMQVRK